MFFNQQDIIAEKIRQLQQMQNDENYLQKKQAEKQLSRKHRQRKQRAADPEKERLKAEAIAKKEADRQKQLLIGQEQKRRAKAERERQRLDDERESRRTLPTRIIDYSQLIPLRIDHRTVVYIRKDQDPEAVKAKYKIGRTKPEEVFMLDGKKFDLPPAPTYDF